MILNVKADPLDSRLFALLSIRSTSSVSTTFSERSGGLMFAMLTIPITHRSIPNEPAMERKKGEEKKKCEKGTHNSAQTPQSSWQNIDALKRWLFSQKVPAPLWKWLNSNTNWRLGRGKKDKLQINVVLKEKLIPHKIREKWKLHKLKLKASQWRKITNT